MLREKASPEFIARGWAIGMFYGCAIPFGFQLVLSIPTAIILKGSKIGATVGTFVTNHSSLFIIYPVQCWIGNRLLGGDLSYGAISHALREVVREQSWDALVRIGEELVAAFFVGGFLFAAIFTPLVYFGVRAFVRRHRARKSAQPDLEGQDG
jgi:uncharacterized protein (DUF2062 family)